MPRLCCARYAHQRAAISSTVPVNDHAPATSQLATNSAAVPVTALIAASVVVISLVSA